jgi:branched-chain amino acid transport system substrate-binding protein
VVTGGGGPPDRLVVADLPFQGGIRLSAQQMEQAMLHTLRERGFRAGRFRLGFQSCDDSIARTGVFDEVRCAENARAYARTPAVVGVLGYVNTPCAAAAIPVLNRADPGPLAVLSALASSPALTRAVPGAPPGELRRLYPTGERNFLRVHPADDLQAVALARLAQDEGARAVAVLDDGVPEYGRLFADRFAAAAEDLGLDVVLRVSWDPQADAFDGLARRVAARGPDAVFVGGLLDTQGAEVLEALHGRLGDGPLRLLPDGFTPTPFLAERAGVAAEGAYLSVPGLLPESLRAAGRRFVRRFAPTQPGADVEPSAVYAAESTAVMLDAIARSDGSRPSVLSELFATRRRGLLGDLAFDDNGDVRSAPVTILRMKRGERSVQVFDDAALERVVG